VNEVAIADRLSQANLNRPRYLRTQGGQVAGILISLESIQFWQE
jgi:hypothetical protein